MYKFGIGQVYVTSGVMELMENHSDEIAVIIGRHHRGDWGDIHEEDALLNDDAVKNGGRILSSYKVDGKKVWVITEEDRSHTTILFPNEY